MNSPIKFLRRVRIHGGECGAVARALHHKARISLPAFLFYSQMVLHFNHAGFFL